MSTESYPHSAPTSIGGPTADELLAALRSARWRGDYARECRLLALLADLDRQPVYLEIAGPAGGSR